MIVVFPAPSSSSPPPASPLPGLLRELVAVLYALWTVAPNEALQWRAACAFELALPLVDQDQEMIPIPSGDLAELRLRLAQLYTVLHWNARGRRWWPTLAAAMNSLLNDLDAEVGMTRAVA
jgi:hypothetical protein